MQPQRRCLRNVATGVVPTFRLKEDHRVGAVNGLTQHPVGVVRVGAGNHLETRRIRIEAFRRLGVVFWRADTASEGDADRHRQGPPATDASPVSGQLGNDLVKGWGTEAVKLDFHTRAVPAHGHTNRCSDDA